MEWRGILDILSETLRREMLQGEEGENELETEC